MYGVLTQGRKERTSARWSEMCIDASYDASDRVGDDGRRDVAATQAATLAAASLGRKRRW